MFTCRIHFVTPSRIAALAHVRPANRKRIQTLRQVIGICYVVAGCTPPRYVCTHRDVVWCNGLPTYKYARSLCDKRVERDRGRVRKTVATINRARYAPTRAIMNKRTFLETKRARQLHKSRIGPSAGKTRRWLPPSILPGGKSAANWTTTENRTVHYMTTGNIIYNMCGISRVRLSLVFCLYLYQSLSTTRSLSYDRIR